MASNVYYSVCTFGTGDIKTGSPTITISSGVATLSVAQTGNIGQGCRITYNTTSIAYISQVNSSTSFNLVTATGSTPGNVAVDQTVNSIAHEYASLSAAEAGASDSSHINNSNLTTADVVLNIVCYYDHVDYTADTTAVEIAGWTTDTTRYINIYTPTGGTQSINNNRHSGVFTTNKYYMNPSYTDTYQYGLTISNSNVIIKGLQIKSESAYGSCRAIYSDGSYSNIKILNCIFALNSNTGGITIASNETATTKVVANCIAYGGSAAFDVSGAGSSNYARLYNCTAANSAYGYMGAYNAFGCVNCISYTNTTDWDDNQYGGGCLTNATNGSSAPGTGSRASQTFSFVNAGANNFHLAANDTAAIGYGTDLHANALYPFSDDIDGETRSSWDIGADEYIAASSAKPFYYYMQQA